MNSQVTFGLPSSLFFPIWCYCAWRQSGFRLSVLREYMWCAGRARIGFRCHQVSVLLWSDSFLKCTREQLSLCPRHSFRDCQNSLKMLYMRQAKHFNGILIYLLKKMECWLLLRSLQIWETNCRLEKHIWAPPCAKPSEGTSKTCCVS